MEKKTKAKAVHQNSLANLSLGRTGRTSIYNEPKEKHNITVTRTGWMGLVGVAQRLGLSASELAEQIGRGDVLAIDVEEYKNLQESLEIQLCRDRLSSGEVIVPYEQVRKEIKLT